MGNTSYVQSSSLSRHFFLLIYFTYFSIRRKLSMHWKAISVSTTYFLDLNTELLQSYETSWNPCVCLILKSAQKFRITACRILHLPTAWNERHNAQRFASWPLWPLEKSHGFSFINKLFRSWSECIGTWKHGCTKIMNMAVHSAVENWFFIYSLLCISFPQLL